MKRLIKIFVLGLAIIFVNQLGAQTGVVRGEVFDENGLLPGVDISVSYITTRINTDADGAFAIKLKPGEYDFLFHFPEYEKSIKKVLVVEDKIKDVEVELFLAAAEKEELGSENELLKLMKSGQNMLSFVKTFLLRIK